MLSQLLSDFFQEEFFDLGSDPEPLFQRRFKTWVRVKRARQHWVTNANQDPDWPPKQEVDELCKLIIKTFSPQDLPTALGHLVLILTPCFDANGQPWQPEDDPIRLPEKVSKFIQCVIQYVQNKIEAKDTTAEGVGHASHAEEEKEFLQETLDYLQANPVAKGVLIINNNQGQMHRVRAIAIPYEKTGQVLPLLLIDLAPNVIADNFIASMQTAAQECVAKLKDAGRLEPVKTVVGGPFSRERKKPAPSFKDAHWGFLSYKLRWSAIGLFLIGLVGYLSFALGGGSILYGLNFFVLPFPSAVIRLGFVLACVFLLGAFLVSVLWSEVSSVLPRKQRQAPTPDNFYFLFFLEDMNGNPYNGQLTDISFGLTFFCACCAAVVQWMQRPPAWAKRLVAMMKKNGLVACSALEGGELKGVEVRSKLPAIQNDRNAMTCVFSLLNLGEVIADWKLKWANFKIRKAPKRFKAKDKSSGIWVLCFEKLNQIIDYALTPYQRRCMGARAFIVFLLLLAFTSGPQAPPDIWLEVLSAQGYKKQYHTAGIIFIKDVQPYEQLTLKIRVWPQIPWPFRLRASSDQKIIHQRGEYKSEIERRMYSWTPAIVVLRMPGEAGTVLVAVTVRDMLKRVSRKNIKFEVAEMAEIEESKR